MFILCFFISGFKSLLNQYVNEFLLRPRRFRRVARIAEEL